MAAGMTTTSCCSGGSRRSRFAGTLVAARHDLMVAIVTTLLLTLVCASHSGRYHGIVNAQGSNVTNRLCAIDALKAICLPKYDDDVVDVLCCLKSSTDILECSQLFNFAREEYGAWVAKYHAHDMDEYTTPMIAPTGAPGNEELTTPFMSTTTGYLNTTTAPPPIVVDPPECLFESHRPRNISFATTPVLPSNALVTTHWNQNITWALFGRQVLADPDMFSATTFTFLGAFNRIIGACPLIPTNLTEGVRVGFRNFHDINVLEPSRLCDGVKFRSLTMDRTSIRYVTQRFWPKLIEVALQRTPAPPPISSDRACSTESQHRGLVSEFALRHSRVRAISLSTIPEGDICDSLAWRLDLSYNDIAIIPARLPYCISEMILDGVPLAEVEENAFDSLNDTLEILSLRAVTAPIAINQLVHVNFERLHTIILHRTTVKRLRDTARFSLPNLKCLDISNSHLRVQLDIFSEGNFFGNNLRHLNISGPQVVNWQPKAWVSQARLEVIDLSMMHLNVTQTNDPIPSLREVHFRGSRLTEVPFGNLPESLEFIDLSYAVLVQNDLNTPKDASVVFTHQNLAKIPQLRIFRAPYMHQKLFPAAQSSEDPSVFQHQAALEELDISYARVSAQTLQVIICALPSTMKRLRLRGLQVNNMILDCIARRAPELEYLDITDSQVTSLRALHTLTMLETLHIGYSKIARLGQIDIPSLLFLNMSNSEYLTGSQDKAFLSLTNLRYLNLESTKGLTKITETMFSALTRLRELDISKTKLEVESNAFQRLSSLRVLDMSGSQFTRFREAPFPCESLEILHAANSRNTVTLLTKIVNCANLQYLDMSRGELTHINGMLLPPSLREVTFSHNKITEIADFQHLSQMTELILSNNRISRFDLSALRNMRSLSQLDLGANDMTEILADADVCKLPNSCRLHQEIFVRLPENRLRSIKGLLNVFTGITLLNVAHNKDLVLGQDIAEHQGMSGVRVLDITETRAVFTPAWCEPEDMVQIFIARDLDPVQAVQDVHVHNFLRECFIRVAVFDISSNKRLKLSHFHNSISHLEFHRTQQEYRTQLQLNGMPIECVLVQTAVAPQSTIRAPVLNGFRYTCRCSQEYTPTQDHCKPKDETLRIVSAVMLTLLSVAVVIVATWYCRRRYKQVSAQLELKEFLIQQSENENTMLRKAWEIEPSDISFAHRIDKDSPGALSEVWKGIWLDQPVAVKVLRSICMSEEGFSAEFQREADFLMTSCKHKNIVRFYGFGQLKDMSPFIVLELMEHGSLNVYIGTHMTRDENAQKPVLSWELRMGFLKGVSQGMEFIHSRGLAHRDLKSANVLVSPKLEAKITDFGSIRNLIKATGYSSSSRNKSKSIRNGASLLKTNMSMLGDTEEDLLLTAGVGTPSYMALEVLNGVTQYSNSADVWSFAVVAWELAAQRSPLLLHELNVSSKGSSMILMIEELKQGRRLPINPKWPEWLRGLLQRCWTEDPKRRPTFMEIVQICNVTITSDAGIINPRYSDFGEAKV